MNKKQKGNRAENQLANGLKEMGFAVQVAQRTSKFIGSRYVSMDNDFFGLFDILYVKNVVGLIQVKSNPSDVSKVKKPIMEFAEKYPAVGCYIYLRVPRKGWIAYCYNIKTKSWVKKYYDINLTSCKKFLIKKRV